MADDDKPGYKRPPKDHQFKRGTSGNPRGRPKGSRNLKTDLTKLLNKRITIREDGNVRHISRQEAMLLGLFNKAIRGDAKAATTIVTMLMKLDPPSEKREEPSALAGSDKAIIDDFLRRRIAQRGDSANE